MGPPPAQNNNSNNDNSNNRGSSSSLSSDDNNSDQVRAYFSSLSAAFSRLRHDDSSRQQRRDSSRNQAPYRSNRPPEDLTSRRPQTARRTISPIQNTRNSSSIAICREMRRQHRRQMRLAPRDPYGRNSRRATNGFREPPPRQTARKSTTQRPYNQVGSKMRSRGGADDFKKPPPGGDAGS